MNNETLIQPQIGMGVTQHIGSDRYPYTIVKVISPKKLEIHPDDYTPDKEHEFDYYSNQVYIYTPSNSSHTLIITLRKNGRWIQQGQSINDSPFSIGERNYYSDPHF
jgi:hypothetical protein